MTDRNGFTLKDSFILYRKASRKKRLAEFMPYRYFGLQFGKAISKRFIYFLLFIKGLLIASNTEMTILATKMPKIT